MNNASPAISIADELRPVLRRLLGRDLPIGLRAWDGSFIGPEDPPVTVVVHRPRALQHMMWAPGELGLVRAHVAGDLDLEGDVYALLGIRDLLAGAGADYSIGFDPGGWWELAHVIRRLGVSPRRPPVPPEEARLGLGRSHTKRRDASAISHHYDVGNDFYRLLLGPSLTYSCAYWSDTEIGLAGAQAAKHELVCRKLGLQPGQRVLDVGCGWGSFAIHAATHHDASVVGVTISEQQAVLARQRMHEAGLADRVEIRVQDYRDVVDGPFDAISSIGMFEHVGVAEMGTYLGRLRNLVRPGGRVLNHAISRPTPGGDSRITPRSFVGRYVFPDAALLEVGTVVSAAQAAGLEVRDVQSLREHYARTLRAWSANLEQHWDEIQRLVGPGRARTWRLYIAGSAIAFEQNRTSVHQVLAVRPHPDGRSDMAPTRAGMDVGTGTPLLDGTTGE
ncbi:MAG: class I SAM-dependent methyltransferase [Acidimicrobiales bacterium]